jgi:hypothetical protein
MTSSAVANAAEASRRERAFRRCAGRSSRPQRAVMRRATSTLTDTISVVERLTNDQMRTVLELAERSVKPTSRFGLLGVTQRMLHHAKRVVREQLREAGYDA